MFGAGKHAVRHNTIISNPGRQIYDFRILTPRGTPESAWHVIILSSSRCFGKVFEYDSQASKIGEIAEKRHADLIHNRLHSLPLSLQMLCMFKDPEPWWRAEMLLSKLVECH